ncbi:hypothetical protein ABID25_006380 [Mesorhizobium abyssinicae]
MSEHNLVARLRRHGRPEETPIAIERPSGLLVDILIEAGFVVTPVHPNVVKACRPRYRAGAAKSDPGDAYILADILRTDGHRLTPLKPQSDAIKALRALVRGRDDLVATRLVLANQLRAMLENFWPGAANLFADIASPIALAFIQRYPTPESVARLGEKRMAAFLAQNQYCGRRSVAEVLGRLRAAPTTIAAEAEADAKGELARATLLLSKASSPRSPSCPAASTMPSPSCPRERSSCLFRAPERSAPHKSPPSWATCAPASRARITSPPRLASHPSPTRAENPAPSPGDGPATNACAPPSPASPTTPGMPALGPQRSIRTPESGDADTLMPCASSPEHGSESSGALGRTAVLRSLQTPRSKGVALQRLTQEVSCDSRDAGPGADWSTRPSVPAVLNRCTQSRSVWRSIPPIRAASARLMPSRTAAIDNSRLLWRASFEFRARRRSSPAEKSVRNFTADPIAESPSAIGNHGAQIGQNHKRVSSQDRWYECASGSISYQPLGVRTKIGS